MAQARCCPRCLPCPWDVPAVPRMSPLSPVHWGGSQTPIEPRVGRRLPRQAPALGMSCWQLAPVLQGEQGFSPGCCPSFCPPPHQDSLGRARMQAGAVGAGIGGDEPCLSCCCLGWACSRKLLVLTGKAEGKELFVQAHLEHLEHQGGRALPRPAPGPCLIPLGIHSPGADIFSRRFQVTTVGRKFCQAT